MRFASAIYAWHILPHDEQNDYNNDNSSNKQFAFNIFNERFAIAFYEVSYIGNPSQDCYYEEYTV